MIRAIIVDNEPKSVYTLNSFLQSHCPQVDIVGTANSARSAKELVQTQKPQLMFLDIEMPVGSGFDLLKSLPVIDFEVIFITAYNQYAINAFRFSAVDYLLKPLGITLLKDAVAKAEQRIAEKNLIRGYELLLRNLNEQNAVKQKIVLNDKGGQYVVQLDEIIYLVGSSNYTHIHTKKGVFLSTRRLKDFEDMIPAEVFCRIHNSYIINIQHVMEVRRGRGGSVIMEDGKVLDIAARRKEAFMNMFLK